MKNFYLAVIFLINLCLFMAGCGTGFCFRVDGEYEGKKGGFEYCYDPQKGILKSDKDEAIIVTKDELQKIKEEDTSISVKSSRKLIDILLDKFKK